MMVAAREEMPVGERGSLKWIQRAVNGHPSLLDAPILARLLTASPITWLSPLAADGFAEYRDDGLVDRLGRSDLREALQHFWPRGGPRWDALARSDKGDVLLIEAKAHVAEMCGLGSDAGTKSRTIIDSRLDELADRLSARLNRAPWGECFYQLANRLAHLAFLRDKGANAWLVLVNFVGDQERTGPHDEREWHAAYQVASHAMGLSRRHALSRYIIEVFPHVRELE